MSSILQTVLTISLFSLLKVTGFSPFPRIRMSQATKGIITINNQQQKSRTFSTVSGDSEQKEPRTLKFKRPRKKPSSASLTDEVINAVPLPDGVQSINVVDLERQMRLAIQPETKHRKIEQVATKPVAVSHAPAVRLAPTVVPVVVAPDLSKPQFQSLPISANTIRAITEELKYT